jgi:hypothetical protein
MDFGDGPSGAATVAPAQGFAATASSDAADADLIKDSQPGGKG